MSESIDLVGPGVRGKTLMLGLVNTLLGDEWAAVQAVRSETATGCPLHRYDNKPPSWMQLSTSIALTGHADMQAPQPLHRACSSMGMALPPA